MFQYKAMTCANAFDHQVVFISKPSDLISSTLHAAKQRAFLNQDGSDFKDVALETKASIVSGGVGGGGSLLFRLEQLDNFRPPLVMVLPRALMLKREEVKAKSASLAREMTH